MTLVELLVVVAIMGLLAVTVLPTLANSAEGRRTRDTTRVLTSLFAQSQTRALAHATGAGFGIEKSGTLASSPGIGVFPAMIPEAYRGDTASASVTISATSSTSSTCILSFTNAFSTGIAVSCTTGDLIRFASRGPWYGIAATGTSRSCTLRSSTAAIDVLASQTDRNTPWPAFGTPHTFEILRQPQRSGGTIPLGAGRCIDVFWSFAGSQRLDMGIPEQPPTIFVIFDAVGSVRQVVAGASRFAPDGPIVLLVGRMDRAGNQQATSLDAADDTVGANWQYADSQWVMIDILSGIVRAAPCAAGAANRTNDVVGSQAYLRSVVQMEAR